MENYNPQERYYRKLIEDLVDAYNDKHPSRATDEIFSGDYSDITLQDFNRKMDTLNAIVHTVHTIDYAIHSFTPYACNYAAYLTITYYPNDPWTGAEKITFAWTTQTLDSAINKILARILNLFGAPIPGDTTPLLLTNHPRALQSALFRRILRQQRKSNNRKKS